jgi:RNA polymerase primary sigma factor
MVISEYKTAETVKVNRRANANTGNPALDSYLNSISDSTPLSMAEEAVLANRIRQGDEDARNALVEANLRFVVAVAKEYQNRGLAMPELISVGNMGLLTAAERFDETKGFKFITYAVWWIRQSIRQALMDQSTVRVPINRLDMMNKVSRTCDELQQREGSINSEEVAKVLGFSEEKVDQLRATPQSLCCSLDAPLDTQDEVSMLDQMEDLEQSNPEDLLLDDSQRENINIVLASLAEREVQIIKLYYGFENGEPMTLEQIGQRFDLTRERVRQIKERALTKLRRPSVYSRLC